MLAGFDADWVDAGDRSFAYYANLPPGAFRFHVIAGSVDGQWNQQGAYFGFQLAAALLSNAVVLGRRRLGCVADRVAVLQASDA